MRPSRAALRLLLVTAGLALAYFVTGRLLIALSAPPNGAVTAVWLPSGISVAALILFGPWIAIGSFFGSIALELKAGTPVPAAAIVALANAGSELLCYYLVAGPGRGGFSMDRVGDGVRLVTAACAISVGSAFIGVTAYTYGGVIPMAEYWPNWFIWFGSAAVGIVLITPFLVYCVRASFDLGPRSRPFEYALAVGILAIAAFVWQGPVLGHSENQAVVLVVLLCGLWIAFRFSPAAMTLAVFSFALSAVWAAVLRISQAPPDTAYSAIFSLQLMLGGLATIGYLLAAMVEEKRRSADTLRLAQEEIVANARRAGMAEIASNVLHNVGNILNSVNVSTNLIGSKLRSSRAPGLSLAVALMEENAADLGRFLTVDEKGKRLPGYLSTLAKTLEAERADMLEELGHLSRSIDHIKDVVATQQSYAGTSSLYQPARICDLVEDALRINGDALARQVTVVKEFGLVPEALLDRTRVMQILVNLISNARHAMHAAGASALLTLQVQAPGGLLRICVRDEGEGIPTENLTRIFAHGFTTRKGGHGFGLHSCALAAQQMGGTLTAESEGTGRGATFTLELPIEFTGAA